MDEVPQLGGVDLLVLGCQEHGGDANQLKLGASDGLDGKKAVHKVHGEEHGLSKELELHVHLHHPVHKDGSHPLGNVDLVGHVVGSHSVHQLQI